MKKIANVILITVLVFSLCACGNSTSGSPESSTEASTTQPTTESRTGFEQFSDGLKEIGLNCEETIIAAEMVGAKEAKRYEDGNNRVELYLFEDGDSFESVKADKAITLEGFGSFPVEVNGYYALSLGDSERKTDILEVFKKVK